MAEAGEIEIHEEGHSPQGGGGSGAAPTSAPGGHTTTGGHRSGDR
jgi:hypothetical protein